MDIDNGAIKLNDSSVHDRAHSESPMKMYQPEIGPCTEYKDAKLSKCIDSVDNVTTYDESDLSVCPSDIPGLSVISWNINGLGDKLGYPHILSQLSHSYIQLYSCLKHGLSSIVKMTLT